MRLLLTLAATAALAGCMNLAPRYERPAAPVPERWGTETPPSSPLPTDWPTFITDERLRQTLPEAGMRATFMTQRVGPYETLVEATMAAG